LGSTALPQSVYDEIERIGALPCGVGRDFHCDVAGDRWNFACGGFELRDLPAPALAGRPQFGNAATALASLVVGPFGLTLRHAAISSALSSVRVPGRFQVIPGDIEWVLDVAHNVPAAMVLATNLHAMQRRRTFAVCGILADKDVAGIAAALAADVDTWIPVALAGPRALTPAELARRLPAAARIDAHAGDVTSGCRRALELAHPGDRVLVFGSFLTVGPALEFLGI
jgi:dihydrofolate synthase/folylpolyglutamate synthase